MRLLRSSPPAPPVDPALIAAEAVARIEADKALAQAAREREIADDDHRRRMEEIRAAGRDAARARRAQRWSAFLGKARTLAPILVVNAAAVYGQLDYAYREVAPSEWNDAASVALAVMFALAVESVALYVGWHAHDALLKKAHATAARLRRASYLIAGVVAAINYTHFANGGVLNPTAAAVAFGLLSLLSPWLWGLHTRRAQHVQLLANDEHLLDESGAEFSAARRRAFPYRTWQARRWSIDHGVSDPRVAWREYNAERTARRDAQVAARAERRIRRDAALAEKKQKVAQPATQHPIDVPQLPVPVAPVFLAPVSAPPAPAEESVGDAPEPDESAGQRVRQDSRTAQQIEVVVRAMRASDPKLSQRKIADAVAVSEATVRRILRRIPEPFVEPAGPVTAGVNGKTPALSGAGHNEEDRADG